MVGPSPPTEGGGETGESNLFLSSSLSQLKGEGGRGDEGQNG